MTRSGEEVLRWLEETPLPPGAGRLKLTADDMVPLGEAYERGATPDELRLLLLGILARKEWMARMAGDVVPRLD